MLQDSQNEAVRVGSIQHLRAVVKEYDKLENKRQDTLRVQREKMQRKKQREEQRAKFRFNRYVQQLR